jgi:hypothetical protein
MLAQFCFKRSRLKTSSNYQTLLNLQQIQAYPNLHMADRAIQYWRCSHFESGKLADDIDSLMLQIFLQCNRLDLARSYYSFISSERHLNNFFVAQCMLQVDFEFKSLVNSYWERNSFAGLEFITSNPALNSDFLILILEYCSNNYELLTTIFKRLKARRYSDLCVFKRIINLALTKKWNQFALEVYQYSSSICKFNHELELERALICIAFGDLHGACLYIRHTNHSPEIFSCILRYLASKKLPIFVFSEWTEYMWEVCDTFKTLTVVNSLQTSFYTKESQIYSTSLARFLQSKLYPTSYRPVVYHINSIYSGVKVQNHRGIRYFIIKNDESHMAPLEILTDLTETLSPEKLIHIFKKETHPSLDLVALIVNYLWSTSGKTKRNFSSQLIGYLSQIQEYLDLAICIYQRIRLSRAPDLKCSFYQSLLNGYGKWRPGNAQYIMKDMENDKVTADTLISTKIIQCMTSQSNQSAEIISNWAHKMDDFAAAVILQSLARSRNHKLAYQFFKMFDNPTVIMYTSLIAAFPRKDGRIMKILRKASMSNLQVDLKFINVVIAYGFKPKYLSNQSVTIVGYKFTISNSTISSK